MATFIKAASIEEIPSGSIKTVVISGKKLALINVDGEFFAVADTCSHEECSLGTEGFLDGKHIICGCHGARFDVATGDALSLPATRPISTYTVKIKGNNVYVYV
jgi:3-phenylpropionate/trans-cinnamate dioxygenase ferredoxin subunit